MLSANMLPQTAPMGLLKVPAGVRVGVAVGAPISVCVGVRVIVLVAPGVELPVGVMLGGIGVVGPPREFFIEIGRRMRYRNRVSVGVSVNVGLAVGVAV